MAKVLVCDKSVHGHIFEIKGVEYKTNGQNTNEIIALNGYTGEHGFTYLEKEVWDEIKKIYGDMAQFVHGIIFEAPSEKEAKAKSKDLKNVKTGQEQHELKDSEKLKEA